MVRQQFPLSTLIGLVLIFKWTIWVTTSHVYCTQAFIEYLIHNTITWKDTHEIFVSHIYMLEYICSIFDKDFVDKLISWPRWFQRSLPSHEIQTLSLPSVKPGIQIQSLSFMISLRMFNTFHLHLAVQIRAHMSVRKNPMWQGLASSHGHTCQHNSRSTSNWNIFAGLFWNSKKAEATIHTWNIEWVFANMFVIAIF